MNDDLKFVELVRNFTQTTGTEDFDLGAAIAGFSSFSATCRAGDRFYYSCISIDHPREREIGRGTLLANGRIKREPLVGANTDFSPGAKVVAMVVPFERIKEPPSASVVDPASRDRGAK